MPGTFSRIGEHAPVAQLDEATELVRNDASIDTVISIGGGSPIDAAKAVSHRLFERSGRYLHHVTVPTTLSAGECTMVAGFTDENGIKTAFRNDALVPHAILYDSTFALHTPARLWLSTGLRALDHAIELMYHPTTSEVPARWMALQAASQLFAYLPKYKETPKDEDVITKLQLAAFASLGFLGLNLRGGLGLSHSLGYSLGAPYGIPHGITSCLTLGHVVKLKADDPAAASQIARMLPFIGESSSGDNAKDATKVGDEVLRLVRDLELDFGLRNFPQVQRDQIPIIVKRAVGSGSGGLQQKDESGASEKVEALVSGLF